MALPKRKHSHSRSCKRTTHYKLFMPQLVECPQCRKLKPAHMVCPFCGQYAGRQIVKIEKKAKKRRAR